LKQQLEALLERIHQACDRSGRDPRTVRLVAVSKTVPAERVRQAVEAGVQTLGENYIQEARSKHAELSDLSVNWHFIGHLQSNKAKYAVRLFDLIHSLDSLKLARELNRQAARRERVQPVLIQVNISREESKSGIATEEIETLVREVAALENIRLQGLMTMPPFFDQPERARPYFHKLFELARHIEDLGIAGVSMQELSMGMSGDFEVAIEEGATLVRVGTAIFGARK
jgi:pyridoxal phosphate enzyme (YggS family)